MTYCIGFRTEQAVFLIADSLITETKKNKQLENIFGRFTTTGRLLEHDKYTFAENVQKVRMLTDGVLITFATNDVDRTLEALDTMKGYIGDDTSLIKDILPTMLEGLEETELLFSYSENGEPKLFSYNLDKKRCIKEHEVGEIVAIGSGKSYPTLIQESEKFIKKSINHIEDNPEDLLTHVLAGLTSFMNSSELLSLLQYQIGGNLLGGYVNGKTSHIMKDTMYLFYAIVNGKLNIKNELSILNSSRMSLLFSNFEEGNDGNFIGYLKDKKLNNEDIKEEYTTLIGDYLKGKAEYIVGIDVYKKGYFLCKQKDYPNFKFRSFDAASLKIQVGLPPAVVDKIEDSYNKSSLFSGGYRINL
ncbi:hypothetical protein [Priestia aryabhattai]|uniref:hypothetical protein n=1 Tax=Priestia aryabhattai TaxID=412384 RepID=UPI003D2A3659